MEGYLPPGMEPTPGARVSDTRQATNARQQRQVSVPPNTGSCTPASARHLRERIAKGWITPSRDGLGGYLVWFRMTPSHGPYPVWNYLSHEDGAPLRFPDTVKAHEKAVDCGVDPAKVSVRWPPS